MRSVIPLTAATTVWIASTLQSLEIDETLCVARGCCYRSGSSPACFYPEGGKVNITKVHIVHGCHFDAGFVDTTTNIVNKYFDSIFPTVHSVYPDVPKEIE